MSLFIEDSPVCELKMDISDTPPSSAESPDTLPVEGHRLFKESDSSAETMKITSTDFENSNELGTSPTTTTRTVSRLEDNRRITTPQPSQLISVDSHPLMSPQDLNDNESTNRFNFQDIDDVPKVTPTKATVKAEPHYASPKRHARLDLLDKEVSSDSEADVSQYQANVELTYQSVSLVSRPPKTNGSASQMMYRDGKSNSCSSIINVETNEDCLRVRQLSAESLSVRSLDEDELDEIEKHRVFFLSRSSSTSIIEPIISTDQTNAAEPSSKNMQKIVLPDGTTRQIDMKVIEPYKRVLSHGGYLKEGCQNAIVIFSSCFLPDRSRADYHYVMDSLFLYVLKTLEQLVTEDYVLLYLHGGSCKSNVPSFPWLRRCYQLLDRRLRKSLKNVYMVHPTFFLKSLVWMSKPFISSKFWRKLIFVQSLDELYALVPSVERQAVPEKVKNYEAHLKKT